MSAHLSVPTDIQASFAESSQFFPTALQQFQFFDKYSRFDYKKGRRETWVETVDRATNFLKEISENKLPEEEYTRIRKGILEMRATPSMRLLAMAGDAARRQNICIYNCSFMAIDSPDSWVEALIISMSGCGVGFSVEQRFIQQLPKVAILSEDLPAIYQVPDTTEGWADSLRFGLEYWFSGRDVEFDYSLVRPEGAPLRIKGGQASGPKPLKDLHDFARATIFNAQGRQLTSLECHDIMCEVGNAAVSGGVRRTAMISLFDWDDNQMRNCKNEENLPSRRWNANNSAVWPEGIMDEAIRRQMEEMHLGGRGEPGVFSRHAANQLKPLRRKSFDFGTNPCGEINLRSNEFCNLTIAIARADDDEANLKEKVELATIIGTIQSMATSFPGLRQKWVDNCKEERLLGVDINGQLDCPVVQDANVMRRLRQHAIETNFKYAQILGISPSASITCVKPSGNSSQLFNCSSGLHARWSPYYIRNVRVSAASPVYKVLRDAGVPLSPENGQTRENATTWVGSFPVKSPDGAVVRSGRSALEQCEYWLTSKLNWTEHNPSVTITYRPEEMAELTNWVVEHKDYIGGMSFLPASDAKYDQMPYTEITKEQYEKVMETFPKEIDFSLLWLYEDHDETTAAMEAACVSGACEIEIVPQTTTLSLS